MKNRTREICTSGSVRDEAGQPPRLLGRRKFLQLGAGIAALPVGTRVGSAQSFPTRTINMVVPYVPGGTTDAAARWVAERMSATLGQPVVIENVSGGSS